MVGNKLIGLILFLLVLWFSLYSKWAFWEPSGFKEGSWAYSTKIPVALKELQGLQPISDVRYRYYMADGVKHETIVQYYDSMMPLIDLVSYFQALGLVCDENDYFMICIGNYQGFNTTVWLNSLQDNVINVEATFLSY